MYMLTTLDLKLCPWIPATKLSKLEHNVQSVPRAKESRSDSNCFLRHLSLGQ